MKKLFIIFLVLFLFCLTFFLAKKKVRADYATDYQNYIDATGNYQISYNSYLTARANYLASGSLDSQSKAQTATLKMLSDRDSLIIAYLTAMKSKINEAKGVSDGDKSTLAGLINTEISWYSGHQVKLSSAGSLNDLVSDSDLAKSQYNDSTTLVIYLGLMNLGVGVNTNIRGELNTEIETLNAKISEIRSNQDKDVSTIQRSLIDVQNKIGRSQDKDNMAKDIVNSIKPNDSQASSQFSTAQSDLTDSNSYLKDATTGLLQIITQIKTAD